MRDKVHLRRSEEGFSASVPGPPGCWCQSEREAEEALNIIGAAIEEYAAAHAAAPISGRRAARRRAPGWSAAITLAGLPIHVVTPRHT